MRTIRLLLIACLGLVPAIRSLAQNITYREYMTAVSALPHDIDVADDRYADLAAGGSYVNFADKEHYGLVSVGFDEDLDICYEHYVKIKVTCLVTGKKYTTPGSLTNISETVLLEAEYSPSGGIVFSDLSYKKIADACSLKVSITAIDLVDELGAVTSVTNPGATLAADVYAEATLVRERYYLPFDVGSGFLGGTYFTSITVDDADNTINLAWDQLGTPGKIQYPDEYEIEWGYVNDYTSGNSPTDYETNTSNLFFTFRNNASRIRVKGITHTKLKFMYDHGYVVFRIRGIWKGGPDFEDEIHGNWDTFTTGNGASEMLSNFGNVVPINPPDNTAFKNWISSVSFAEDGLHKPVVQYADGSGRVRQTVSSITKDNSKHERVSIVTETFYDYRGRAAVQSLPVPVLVENGEGDAGTGEGDFNGSPSTSLQYFNNFNLKEGTTEKYAKQHFDVDGLDNNGDCVPEIPGFDNATGAGMYYSSSNPIGGYHAYVPDAQHFPFTHTVYERDNTGRIRSQSGVGIDHTTGSGHETVYAYNVPNQAELDRLFGTDVGYASHYKKNVVQDANGQYSVSYLNMSGQVIATSLAGQSPDNVNPLTHEGDDDPMYETDAEEVTADLLNKDANHPYGTNNTEINNGTGRFVSHTFTVMGQKEYIFDYQAIGKEYYDACAPTLCADCVYDLKITLTDRCGNNKLPSELTGSNNYISYRIGNRLMDTICDPGDDTLHIGPDVFSILLDPGDYTLTKELTVNMAAVEYYAQKFIENSTCLPTIDDYMVEPDDCYPDCEANPEDCAAADADWERNFCKSAYEIMQADMKPNGQYGYVLIGDEGQVDQSVPADYILSVYAEVNLLPKRDFCGTGVNTCTPPAADADLTSAYWRNPRYKNPSTGVWETMYMDEDGVTESRVLVSLDIYDQWTPAILPGVVPATDPGTGARFVRPQDLKNLEDFLGEFKYGAWEKSLVVYHPEYFYYEGCVELEQYTYTVGSQTLNTWQYEQYVNDIPLTQFQSEIGDDDGLKANDPIFAGTGSPFPGTLFMGVGSSFDDLMDAFIAAYLVDGPTTYDMLTSAQAIAHCGGTLDISTCMAAYVPVTSVADDDVRSHLVNSYIGRKQILLQWYLTWYSMLRGGTTWCVDGENIGSTLAELSNTAEPKNPCDLFKSVFYFGKEKRFVGQANVSDQYGFGDPPDTEAMKEYADQVYYNETGNCPGVRDLELFVKLLLQKDKLYPAQTNFNVSDGNFLPPGLAQMLITAGATSPIEITSLYPVADSDKKLQMSFAGIDCPLTISFPYNSPYTFADIIDVQNISNTMGGGGSTFFTIKVLCSSLTAQETVTLTGSVCLPLTECNQSFKAICKVKPVGYSIRMLMNMLTNIGEIYNTSGYTLVAPVTQYVDAPLQSYLGAGTYTWTWDNTNQKWILYNSTLNKSLFISITGSVNFSTANEYTFASAAPVNSTEASPLTAGTLKLTGYESSPIPYPTVAYDTELELDITSDFGMDIITTDCQLATENETTCNTEAHKNLQTLTLLLTNLAANGEIADGDCMPKLTGFADGTSGFTWDNVTEVLSVSALLTPESADGITSYYFTATVTYNSETREIKGKWCKPIRNCESCETTCSGTVSNRWYIKMDITVPTSVVVGITNFCLKDSDYPLNPLYDLDETDLNTISYHETPPGWTPEQIFTDWAADINALGITGIEATVVDGSMYISFPDDIMAPGFNEKCNCSSADHPPILVGSNVVQEDPEEEDGQIFFFAGNVSKRCCPPPTPTTNVIDDEGEVHLTETEWPPQDNLVYGQTCDPDMEPFPTTEYVDNCNDQLTDLATLNAQNALDAHIAAAKAEYKRNLIAKCMEVAETLTMQYTLNEYHFTLYYYDQAGNLVRTVPPRAVTPIPVADLPAVATARAAQTDYRPDHNTASLGSAPWDLGTRYVYNSLNAVSAQHTPDAGTSQFWYDNLGRVVLSQNAKQATETANTYSFTQYDALGRIVTVGKMVNTSILPLTESVVKTPSALEAWMALPSAANLLELTQTTYDVVDPANPPAGFTQHNLRGRVSSVFYRNVSTSLNSAVHYDYDFHGNVQTVLNENFALQALNQHQSRVDYTYDLVSGKVRQVAYNMGHPDAFYHRYRYDDDNRLIDVETSLDQTRWETDANYQYYLHGPLARTEYGNKVQGVDYAYTIQGWIKGVNADNLGADIDISQDGSGAGPYGSFSRDAYAYSLSYFNNDYLPVGGNTPFSEHPAANELWNGNIRSMNTTLRDHRVLHEPLPLVQTFVYDQLNRIRQSTAYNDLDLPTNVWGGTPLDIYATVYTYDQDGNILSLGRHGNDPATPKMDELTYEYAANNNKLLRVADVDAYGSNYATDIDNQPDAINYAYDVIGNLVQDKAEEIQEIKWTLYGKVAAVIRQSGSTKPDLEFTYGPSGQRLSKKVIPHIDAPVTTTYYTHDAQGNVMAIYTHTEAEEPTYTIDEHIVYGSSRLGERKNGLELLGYVSSDDPIPHPRGLKRYELSNHLGNVNLVLSDRRLRACDEGSFLRYEADILHSYDYYPFGMLMPGRTYDKAREEITNMQTVTEEILNEDFDGLCSTVYQSDFTYTCTETLNEDFTWDCTSIFSEDFTPNCAAVVMSEDFTPSTTTAMSTIDFNAGTYNNAVFMLTNTTNGTLSAATNALRFTTPYTAGLKVVMQTPTAGTYTASFNYAEISGTIPSSAISVPGGNVISVVASGGGLVEYTFTTGTATTDLTIILGGSGYRTASVDNFTLVKNANNFGPYSNSGTLTQLTFNNQITYTTSNSGQGIKISVPTTAGLSYTARFHISDVTTSSITATQVSATGGNVLTVTADDAHVEYTFTGAAASSSTDISVLLIGTGTKTSTLDSLTVCQNGDDLGFVKSNGTLSELSFNNRVTFTTPNNTQGIKLTLPTTPGHTYTARFDLAKVTTSTITSMQVSSTGNALLTVTDASDYVEYTFTAPAGAATSTDVLINLVGTTGSKTATLDNFSFCENSHTLGYITQYGTLSEFSFSDEMTFATPTSGYGVNINLATTIGSTYTVSFKFTPLANVTSAAVTGGNYGLALTSATQTVHYTFKATATQTQVRVAISGSNPMSASIDDLTVCQNAQDLSLFVPTNTVSELSFFNDKVTFSTPNNGQGLKILMPTTAGKTYTAKFDYATIANVTSTNAQVYTANAISTGTWQFTFVAPAGPTSQISVTLTGGAGQKTASIDNFSYCENTTANIPFSAYGTLVEPVSFTGGSLSFKTTSAIGSGVQAQLDTEPGKTYTVTFDYTATAATTTASVQATGNAVASVSPGAVSYTFTATAASSILTLVPNGASTFATVDNFTVTTDHEEPVVPEGVTAIPVCNTISSTYTVHVINDDLANGYSPDNTASSSKWYELSASVSAAVTGGSMYISASGAGIHAVGRKFTAVSGKSYSVKLKTWKLSASDNNLVVRVRRVSDGVDVYTSSTLTVPVSSTTPLNVNLGNIFTAPDNAEYILVLERPGGNNVAVFIDDVDFTYDDITYNSVCTWYASDSYRFGFNGKEKVDEAYGEGNAYDFGARIYNPRIGRWLAVDPLARKYTDFSPYNFAINNPILYFDYDGRDIIIQGLDKNTGTVVTYAVIESKVWNVNITVPAFVDPITLAPIKYPTYRTSMPEMGTADAVSLDFTGQFFGFLSGFASAIYIPTGKDAGVHFYSGSAYGPQSDVASFGLSWGNIDYNEKTGQINKAAFAGKSQSYSISASLPFLPISAFAGKEISFTDGQYYYPYEPKFWESFVSDQELAYEKTTGGFSFGYGAPVGGSYMYTKSSLDYSITVDPTQVCDIKINITIDLVNDKNSVEVTQENCR